MHRNPLCCALRLLLAALVAFACAPGALAQRQVEALGRGVIATRGVDLGGNGTNNWTGGGANQVYIGWRLFASDPADIAFNVYRSANGGPPVKLNAAPLTAGTNFVDTAPTLTVANTYFVRAVVNGVEGAPSVDWTLPANSPAEPCVFIPFEPITPGANPDPNYYVHMAWAGDLDGDGSFDLVVNRLPVSNTSLSIKVEAYSARTRALLWRADLGPNAVISNGQNDGLTVFDFDGDGRSEVICKTSVGTVFGNNVTLTGAGTPQYLSVLDGATGAERSRLLVAASAGAGTEAKNIGVAFLDGVRPNLIVMNENHDYVAYNYHPITHQLAQRWFFDSPSSPYPHGHQFRVADVDGDGKDEICDVGMVIDGTGQLLWITNGDINHGDRFHVTDFDPDRPGLETFAVQQDNPSQLSTVYYDARTGQILNRWYNTGMTDNGRGNAGDIDASQRGVEFWSSSESGLFNAQGVRFTTNKPGTTNFSMWWDEDVYRDILNRTMVDRWTGTGTTRILTANNYRSATYSWRDAPPLYGDFFGDWREELVCESSNHSGIAIYSTSRVTSLRFPTFLHDPQYRLDLTLKGYMQTHQPGFYFGGGMARPPRAPYWGGDLTWVGGPGDNVWNAIAANWKTSATNVTAAYADGQSVLFDLTGYSDAAVALEGALAPALVVAHVPAGQSYTFSGNGSLTGNMTLVKAGQGSLTLANDNSYTGLTTVNEGVLLVNGHLTAGAVQVESRGVLGGGGVVAGGATVTEAGGGVAPGGVGAAGTLVLGGLTQTGGAVNYFDLANTPSGAGDLIEVAGNLTLTGSNVLAIALPGGAPAAGVYTLFTYSGGFTGNVAQLQVRGLDGVSFSLADTGSTITLTVGALRAGAEVTWVGGAGNVWSLAGAANWQRSGAPDTFATGDDVTFDSTGAANATITLGGPVVPGSTVVNAATNYTLTGSGHLGGGGGLTKSGAGMVTVNTANTYTGPTVIQGGTLAVSWLQDGGFASPLGVAGNASANLVLNGGTLRLAGNSSSTFRSLTLGAQGGGIDVAGGVLLNLGGVVSGGGALTKQGAGMLILNAVNTYTGGTFINAGTVRLTGSRESNSPTSSIRHGLGTGSVTLNGGTLALSDTSVGDFDFVNYTAPWNLVVPAGASGRLEAAGRMVFNGTLAGAGNLTFFTPFVRTDLSGNWAGFTGAVNVVTDGDGGDFRLGSAAGLPQAAVSLGNLVVMYSRAPANSVIPIGELAGPANAMVSAGLGSGAGANNATTWRVGGRGGAATFAGMIRGTSPVIKDGAGVWTLTGNNTHTGATTLAAGTLAVPRLDDALTLSGTMSTGSANVTVASTATLAVGMGVSGTGIPSGARILAVANTTTFTLGVMGVATNGTAAGVNSLTFSRSPLGLSSPAAANLTFNGGTLRHTGVATATARLFTLGPNGGALEASGTGALTLNGTSAIVQSGSGARTLRLGGNHTGNNTLAAVIADGAGPVALEKYGNGVWILTNHNSYTGGTTVSAGTLRIGTFSTSATLAPGPLVNFGRVEFVQFGNLTFGGNISGPGTLSTDFDLVTLTGNNTSTGPVLAGNLEIGNGGTGGNLGTGNVTIGSRLIFNRAGSLTQANTMTGPGGLDKRGPGIVTLSGNLSYTGSTLVTAGTLRLTGQVNIPNTIEVLPDATLILDGEVTALTVFVRPGGLLKGAGNLTGNLTVQGTVALDSGTGTALRVTGAVLNLGTMRVTAGTGLQVSGNFSNWPGGTLDVITAGPVALGALHQQGGTYLDAGVVRVQGFQNNSGLMEISIQSYPGHDYQLQRTASLSAPAWQNVGPPQAGTGGVLTFTDPAPENPDRAIYRIVVAP